MQMRPEVQLKSAIKALTDVVLPAVDANNKLAQEQARLVIGLLTLLGQQLPLQFRFDCDELARMVDYAQSLQALAAGGAETQAAGKALAGVQQAAAATLEGVKSSPDAVLQAVRALRTSTGAVISALQSDGDAAARAKAHALTLSMSKEQLLRDRSWLLMQGWEPDPKSIPAIDTLLAPLRA